MKVFNINTIKISMVECDASNVYRNNQHIAASTEDVFMLHLQLEGQSLQTQNGKSCVLMPGDLSICDSIEPYSLCFNEKIKMMVIKVPFSIMLNHVARPELLAGLKLSNREGIGCLLINHLMQLWQMKETLSGTIFQTEIENTLSSLLSMTVQQTYPNVFGSTESACNTQLIRLRNYIATNLADPNLSPCKIAQENGISWRYMRKIFNGENTTCSRQISSLRIEKIAEELKKQDGAKIKIGQIAFNWGFNNVSHFSRAFKEAKGVSPKAYRNKFHR